MATVSRTVYDYEIQAVRLYLDDEGNPQKELVCSCTCKATNMNRATARATCAEVMGEPMPRSCEYTWAVVAATKYTMELGDFMAAADAEPVETEATSAPTDSE